MESASKPPRGTGSSALPARLRVTPDEHDSLDNAGGSPQSVVAFMLEQRGMTRAELHAAMGGKARVSEFFAGKRRLSVEQIRALRDLLRIPADLLIG